MSGRVRWPAALAVGLALAALVIAAGAIVLRPTSNATVEGIAIECDGVGSADACGAWAVSQLERGPGIRVFDPEDLQRVRLVRPFPLPGTCRAEYFVGRDPDSAVATETVDCPAG